MSDLGLLIARVIVGGLVAGHGAQKLFGWDGGPGLHGFAGWLESMGMRPSRHWAWLGALAEFGGGVLTVLGFLGPLGPLGIVGAMGMATVKAHLKLPIWASKGGGELALTNLGAVSAILALGPGALSLDHALGIRLPRWLVPVGLLGAAAAVAYGLATNPRPQRAVSAAESAAGAATASPQPVGAAGSATPTEDLTAQAAGD